TAYEDEIDANPMNSLSVGCRFDCRGGLPYGYREQVARVPGVVTIGASAGLGGYHQERSQRIYILFVDEGYRAAYNDFLSMFDDAQWQALQTRRDGLYFSRSAAARWQVKEGDTYTLTTTSPVRADGSANCIFTVLGVVEDYPHGGQGPAEMIFGNYEYLE